MSADADVEGRDRLIADDEFRPQSECAGYADALTLSAGEFVRVAEPGRFVEPDRAQEFGDAGMSSSARPDSRGRLSPLNLGE